MKTIKVLIVDDSKLVREILSEVMAKFSDVTVVGAARDAFEAREMIKALDPEVITLDVEMPKMDGITFLKNIMRLRPMPVIMLSTLTSEGAETTLEALECGAIDFISKPRSSELLGNINEFSEELHEKINLAAKAQVNTPIAQKNKKVCQFESNSMNLNNDIIALGASTGGTEALRDVLSMFPVNSPAIVVTQHIPKNFSKRFASRLNAHCDLSVQEAKQGTILKPGNIYIAPGDQHLIIKDLNNQYICQLSDEPARNRHKPSVDVMFESLSKLNTVNIYAGLLTGMGNDGASGLLTLKQQGHYTLIQNKATSLIWGMPGAASKLNAHCDEASLTNIAITLLNNIKQKMVNRTT